MIKVQGEKPSLHVMVFHMHNIKELTVPVVITNEAPIISHTPLWFQPIIFQYILFSDQNFVHYYENL
jgi:hypothetical protein